MPGGKPAAPVVSADQVRPAAAPPVSAAVAPQQLPATGSPAAILAMVAAGLMLAGIVLVVRSRAA